MPTEEAEDTELPQARYHDLADFYGDPGPPGGWDSAVTEYEVTFKSKRPRRGSHHVIKERQRDDLVVTMGDDGGCLRVPALTLTKPKTVRVAAKQPPHIPKVNLPSPGLARPVAASFLPPVQPWASARTPVQQLASLRAAEASPRSGQAGQQDQGRHEARGGPFNFQGLLRKSAVLPTDTLRQRRDGPVLATGQVL